MHAWPDAITERRVWQGLEWYLRLSPEILHQHDVAFDAVDLAVKHPAQIAGHGKVAVGRLDSCALGQGGDSRDRASWEAEELDHRARLGERKEPDAFRGDGPAALRGAVDHVCFLAAARRHPPDAGSRRLLRVVDELAVQGLERLAAA